MAEESATPEALRFDDKGLIPAIAQDAATGRVLMLAYMNRESLEQTLRTGYAHYWSRSRRTLWKKGESSGHVQAVKEIRYDCDADALLLLVEQTGPACHTGQPTCFYRSYGRTDPSWQPLPPGEDLLERLYAVIQDRKARRPQGSYVAGLLDKGLDAVLKKVAEESGETLIAAKNAAPQQVIHEMADLWFHSLVLLAALDIPPGEVWKELTRRFGTSGLAEKAARERRDDS